MIAVVDSGVANLASVMGALHRLQVEAEITSDADKIRTADRVILPGVGAVDPAMRRLRSSGLVEVLRGLTQPVLGICLGMQLMFTSSEEGQEPCLDVIQGKVVRLPATPEKPVPHMGWNEVKMHQAEHPLLKGVLDNSFFYFVHSFAAPSSAYTVASSNYGMDFTAIAASRNFFGCQFHPERSSLVGSRILKNFVEL